MKKLLFIGALLCVLCSCGSGNGGAKKFNEDVKLALEQEMYGVKERAIMYYEAALELEKVYSGTEYAHWFNSDAAGKLEELKNPKLTGTHKNHEWVDLGLSVKRATCNVGASSPGDYGNYYAWGETKTKSAYNTSNCASYGESWSDITGNSSHDAARANWGGNWRLPTNSELEELKNNCTWTWTTQNGHKGYKVTSKKNGQSIFLPAAGYRRGDTLCLECKFGYFWSSTPYDDYCAYYLFFFEGFQSVNWYGRYDGFSVRPVLED